MWQDFSNAIRDLWQASEPKGGSYRADLHYMRGPGPKWHARHAGFVTAAPVEAKQSVSFCRTPKLPRCPSCAQVMPLTRTTQRYGSLPVLHTFTCRSCDVMFTREAA